MDKCIYILSVTILLVCGCRSVTSSHSATTSAIEVMSDSTTTHSHQVLDATQLREMVEHYLAEMLIKESHKVTYWSTPDTAGVQYPLRSDEITRDISIQEDREITMSEDRTVQMCSVDTTIATTSRVATTKQETIDQTEKRSSIVHSSIWLLAIAVVLFILYKLFK